MPRSPLLDRPGAVAGDGLSASVAVHYGDPMREQRLLEEGLAVVDLSHRDVLTVTGADRLSWLHSLTTQALTGLAPRESREALILTPKGHVEHSLHLVDDGERTWVTTEPGAGAALLAWLDRMRFMLRVEVADVSAEWAVLGEPHDAESAPGEPIAWRDPWPGLVGDSAAYGPVEGHPGADRAWREVLVPRATLPAAVGDRPLAGVWAEEALRIAAWRPRLGHETDHRTLVHEVDWLRTAVHLHKGCYRGQETVARVHNLGRPPRRLVFLHLDGSGHVLPPRGAEVRVGDRAVGFLTSVGRHHTDGPIALALIKRSTDPEAELVVDGTSAAQTVIVAP
ncbi:MAG TPA: glycine cleavage T C-terminal barrel domain-containing protein [Intrasporangium sp.]|uniref:CAF17-like 4Fe-4S cluster assembly/insertion protein YgfZ n=1 Tax=Intrasporangium sp. TaxID=1925024 RepID=UPI002D77A00C|nr:glycine cleavage T C-terminal barrel domain-containing protein [Intrasporangium sp.]HET7396943.1 glycine cleavage T C-terminal barrel domain-containing protein [Intrasporangium sp.]